MSRTEEGGLGVMAAFPTNIGLRRYHDVEDLNNRLRTAIYRRRGDDPQGMYRSNTAGTWHSDTDLMKWIGIPEVGAMFADCFRAYTTTYGVSPQAEIGVKLQAWAMLYRNGGYATVHTHPNCHFSGVYYIDSAGEETKTMVTGERTCPGDIEFIDTRATGGYQFPGVNFIPAFRLTPKAGDLIVFPSWLPHFVHPVVGDRDRMCIACNATIVKHVPPPKKDNSNDSDQ